MYNVLEQLRQGEVLTTQEQSIHEQGLVGVLGQIHDDLDRAVLQAYGWDDLAAALVGHPGGTTPLPDKPTEQTEAEEALLERLVALNTRRAAEEHRGHIRWLRPDYQNPAGTGEPIDAEAEAPSAVAASAGKQPWPSSLADQAHAIRVALEQIGRPITAQQLAGQFKRARVKRVEELLETLSSLGQARRDDSGLYLV